MSDTANERPKQPTVAAEEESTNGTALNERPSSVTDGHVDKPADKSVEQKPAKPVDRPAPASEANPVDKPVPSDKPAAKPAPKPATDQPKPKPKAQADEPAREASPKLKSKLKTKADDSAPAPATKLDKQKSKPKAKVDVPDLTIELDDSISDAADITAEFDVLTSDELTSDESVPKKLKSRALAKRSRNRALAKRPPKPKTKALAKRPLRKQKRRPGDATPDAKAPDAKGPNTSPLGAVTADAATTDTATPDARGPEGKRSKLDAASQKQADKAGKPATEGKETKATEAGKAAKAAKAAEEAKAGKAANAAEEAKAGKAANAAKTVNAAKATKTPNDPHTKKKARKGDTTSKRRQKLEPKVLVLTLVIILGVVYNIGVAFFAGHALPKTTLAGTDVSLASKNGLASMLDDALDTYVLKVTGNDFSLDIAADEVGLKADTSAVAQKIIDEQNEMIWPYAILSTRMRTSELGLEFDEAAIKTIVEQAVSAHNKDGEDPTSATLEFDDQNAQFSLVAEKKGSKIDADAVVPMVEDALEHMDSNLELGDEALVQPAVRADSTEAKAALNKANRMLNLRIPFTLNGNTVAELTPELIASWVSSTSDLEATINEEAVGIWADGQLWRSIDTYDDYGAYVLDSTGLADKVLTALRKMDPSPIALTTTYAEYYTPYGGYGAVSGWESSMGRYIDVDKTNQYAVLYGPDGQVMWESEITTGNESVGNGTPLGTYNIYDKKTDFTLIGYDEDGDGEPDYEHTVGYWMPFNGGIGLHDAYWRSAFGGQVYLTGGSNGCVNLPSYSAQTLYALTHIGEVVYVHESAESAQTYDTYDTSGYDDQSIGYQTYDDSSYTDQTYSDQTYDDTTYSDQTYDDYSYADQTYADQTYSDQTY